MVAYVFPPLQYAGTFRSIRLSKGFHEQGIETHVLTIKEYDDIQNDYKLLKSIPKQVNIHRTPIIDPWRWFQNWKKRHSQMWGFKYVNKVVSFFLWFLCLPDHMVLWVPFALCRGISVIRKYDIKTVYVSSPPQSTQFIGLLLKKITGVRLIADFRDPIIGNAYASSFNDSVEPRSRIERKLNMQLEHLIVENADKIVVNTETHRKEMMVRYGKDTVVTVRNSFDASDFEGIDTGRYGMFTIAHVGSMYGLRRPDVLFKAIKQLEKQYNEKPLNMQVLFVGLNEPYLAEGIACHNVEKFVKILPVVPHDKAIEIMVRSHLLLLIKATGQDSIGQIPGKFYEYLGTGNRILLLGPRESEVANIIREINAGYVIEEDEDELAVLLSREYKSYLDGCTKRLIPSDMDKFSAKHMVSKMIELL